MCLSSFSRLAMACSCGYGITRSLQAQMCKWFFTSAYSCILQCLTGQSKSCGQPTFKGWRNRLHFFLGGKECVSFLQSIIGDLRSLIEGEVPMFKDK